MEPVADEPNKLITGPGGRVDEKTNGSPLQETECGQSPQIGGSSRSDQATDLSNKLQLILADEHGPTSGSSLNRDLILAKLNRDKVLSIIKAWEENEKRKSLNSFNRKMVKVGAWEVAEKARTEASLRTIEGKLEKKRAAYIERANNQIARVQKAAEQHRAILESRRGQEMSKAEETAARCRASGTVPWRFPFCY